MYQQHPVLMASHLPPSQGRGQSRDLQCGRSRDQGKPASPRSQGSLLCRHCPLLPLRHCICITNWKKDPSEAEEVRMEG